MTDWVNSESAISAAKKLFILLHDQKPTATKTRDSFDELDWDRQLVEVRKWCIQIHYRRIHILQEKLK